MNQGKLKTFAVEARRELLEKVALQARKIGVTEDSIQDASVESSDALMINGQHLSKERRLVGYLFQCINCGQHRLHVDCD